MAQNLSNDMLDKLTKVCICKGIPRSAIKAAIAEGADSVEAVKKVTGAGSGSCGGRRCIPKIQEFLQKQGAEE